MYIIKNLIIFDLKGNYKKTLIVNIKTYVIIKAHRKLKKIFKNKIVDLHYIIK